MEKKKHASILRSTRKIHRQTGITLFFLFIIVGITGLFLGWKKNVDVLQYPSQRGVSNNVSTWLSTDSLVNIATTKLVKWKGKEYSTEIDKIDARPDKGMVKVIFKEHHYSLQLDAETGEVLSYEYRTSDLIEQLHDGTFIDKLFGLPGGVFKLFYTTVLGTALVLFSVSGFWLWYGPKIMRKDKKISVKTIKNKTARFLN